MNGRFFAKQGCSPEKYRELGEFASILCFWPGRIEARGDLPHFCHTRITNFWRGSIAFLAASLFRFAHSHKIEIGLISTLLGFTNIGRFPSSLDESSPLTRGCGIRLAALFGRLDSIFPRREGLDPGALPGSILRLRSPGFTSSDP
jgi:hypothetical protein